MVRGWKDPAKIVFFIIHSSLPNSVLVVFGEKIARSSIHALIRRTGNSLKPLSP
jgi:hypothetical protein